MFSLTPSMNYYLYPYPTDMRKSFYTLSGIVLNQMERNVQDGEVFIFINRYCTGMKVLHMECGGLVIYLGQARNDELPAMNGNNKPAMTNR